MLDTNIVSMFSPSRAGPPMPFLEWLEMRDQQGQVFLSAVTVHEIAKGIALLDHKGAAAKTEALRVWNAGLVASYDDRILGFDAEAASLAGRLEAKAIMAGHDPGMADAAIAGIAQTHDLVIVTANRKHFLPFGVSVATPDELIGLP